MKRKYNSLSVLEELQENRAILQESVERPTRWNGDRQK